MTLFARAILLGAAVTLAAPGGAGPLRERLAERRAQAAGVTLLRDIAYGSDERQRLDVYAPKGVRGAPVIFMVHGGAWRIGDKSARGVAGTKAAHWNKQGFIVVSVNYRMLPEADVATQAADVKKALALAQDKADSWGGERRKFILMGHSAGAHLVSLLASAPPPPGFSPWLGTVSLDSAAMDVELLMQQRHARLYDEAFGTDPAYWRAVSPYAVLAAGGAPLLAVCSTQRDAACPQAQRYAAKAEPLGMQVRVLAQDLSHQDINHQLGEAGAYTAAVDAFIERLPGLK